MAAPNNAKIEKELLAQKLRAQALLHLQKEGQAVEKIPLTGVIAPKKDVGKGGDNTLDIILRQKAKELSASALKPVVMTTKDETSTPHETPKEVIPPPAAAVTLPLPPGWQEVPDASTGRSYYWNVHTNQTTWERPAAPSVSSGPQASQVNLPEGWVEKTHPATRQKYYSHPATGRTSVTLPVASSGTTEQGKRQRDAIDDAAPHAKR